MFSVVILFLSLAHIAFSIICPLPCTYYTNQVVCASDGRTYRNPCEVISLRKCNGRFDLHIMHKGRCSSGMKKRDVKAAVECDLHAMNDTCTKEYVPVCGSNGRTYSNKCIFCNEMKNLEKQGVTLTLKHPGSCQADDYCPPLSKQGMCTMEYNPVCGSDGITYPNVCVICTSMYEQQRAGSDVKLEVISEGEC